MTKLVFSGGSMNTPLCLARVLMLLVCISAPFAPCLAQPPIEPSWNGKYLSHYLRELNNPDPIQRQLSCEAIGSMGSTAAAAVPELSKLLESKEPSDRIAAAMALAKIGDAAKSAIPLLQKMEQSADVNEKKVAQITIMALEPPVSTVAFEFLSSAYVLSFLVAALIGGAVALLFWKRRAKPTKRMRQRRRKEHHRRALARVKPLELLRRPAESRRTRRSGGRHRRHRPRHRRIESVWRVSSLEWSRTSRSTRDPSRSNASSRVHRKNSGER
ncbi:MAG: HEAT repeat domain-containing protein [Blastocatellia bacterium]|nr:HEAT repeat domain-containing protein [Blastocatellia bacterium]